MSRLLFGKRPVAEALESGVPKPEKLFLAKGMERKEADLLSGLALKLGIPVEWVARRWLEERCDGALHQGVAAQAPDFKYAYLDELLRPAASGGILVVLDQVEDPHNLGAVIRVAEGAGALGVVIAKDHAAQVTPVVEKAAAGATAHLSVAQVVNVSQALDEIKAAGFWCYGLAGEAGESLYEQKFSGKVCLVLGSEGKGLRPLVAKHCDKLLKLPMRGKVASLNVSVAAGIALFEVARQLDLTPP